MQCPLLEQEFKLLSYSENHSFDAAPKSGFLLVKDGFIKIGFNYNSSTQNIGIAGPTELINLNTNENSNYILTAIGKVNAYFIEASEIFEFTKFDPKLHQYLSNAFLKTMNAREKQLHVLSKRSVLERVSGTLMNLNDIFNPTSESYSPITLDKKTIADLANTTIETLARTLTDLEKEKVLKRVGPAIQVLSIEKLKKHYLES